MTDEVTSNKEDITRLTSETDPSDSRANHPNFQLEGGGMLGSSVWGQD